MMTTPSIAAKPARTKRVALIGAGYMAKLHALSMGNLEGLSPETGIAFEKAVIVDTDRAAADHAAARWGFDRAEVDWRSVVDDPRIDVVDISTPNASHEAIAEAAFAAGKDVLCEKPLAATVESAARMTRAAVASGTVHFVNFTYRAWPMIAEAKRLIDDGRLGQIRFFDGHFFQDHNDDATIPRHWRFERDKAGAGALGDIGAHIIDLARFLAGDIAEVAANEMRFVDERPVSGSPQKRAPVDVDDFASMLVRFESGASGAIHASWALPGFKNDVFFTIVGEKGALRFSWERSNELQYFDRADEARLSGYRTIALGRAHPGADLFWFPDLGGERGVGVTAQGMGYGDAFLLSFKRFAENLAARETRSPNFLDGLRTSEIMHAAQRSAAERRWVDVEKHPIREQADLERLAS